MYTWGYIKDACLAKLDLDENEADVQDLINRFYIYANEVITQVCSSIKPKCTFVKFIVTASGYCKDDNGNYKLENGQYVEIVGDYDGQRYSSCNKIGDYVTMPQDFISFGDDVCYQIIHYGNNIVGRKELHDTDFDYQGYNKIIFFHCGEFYISYNARWYTFDSNTDNYIVLDIPTDILDCIPSYVASQCYKIDDEYKAQVFRNEYEIMLARIDATNFKNTKTIEIGGDW